MFNHIYIHFPFCLKKCHYCDFNSIPTASDQIPFQEYISAVEDELKKKIEMYASAVGEVGKTIKTLYFGGGTPSLMPADQVEKLMKVLDREIGFADKPEVTIECNPGTVDKKKLADFQKAGVNRFSLGVQSFHDETLKKMGRIHTSVQAKETLRSMTDLQGARVSADLIYGMPGQTLAEWEEDLSCLLDFGINHISCYALTIEEKTALAKMIHEGRLSKPDPDVLAEMQRLTYQVMEQAGMPAYEISNFAKLGYESQHNLAYWNYRSFLGLGVGAVGQLKNEQAVLRISNDFDVKSYISGDYDFHVENIDKQTAQKEFIMMGMRLRKGIDYSDFQRRFDVDIVSVYERSVSEAIEKGWRELDSNGIRPTTKGFLFNNQLTSLFF